MRSPGVGAGISGDRVTNTTTTGFTGGPWTFTRTAVASSAETIATFKVSDDSTGKFEILNNTATGALFLTELKGTAAGSNIPMTLTGIITTDTGTGPGVRFNVATAAAAALTTRTLYEWRNNNTAMWNIRPINSGADSFLTRVSTGLGAPAFTTRSSGTGIVLRDNISGSTLDYAFGTESGAMWATISQATSSFSFKWYGGTTAVMTLRGDGRLQTTGGRVATLRVATTTPVTAAVTDYVIVTNLGTPGAVAVNLFATPTTGTVLVIKDGKGDAAANNITITPAAGNIDGAGTLVLSSNYARATLAYNGTEWNRID